VQRSVQFGLAGSVLALGTTALYLVLILSEGNNDASEILPFATTFGGVGLLALAASLLPNRRLRLIVFALGGAVLIGIGLLAISSVGTFLVVAGALLIVAAELTAAEQNGEGGIAVVVVAAAVLLYALFLFLLA
jgi:hypothetical protein